jgi:hypothetical protein
MGLSLRQNFGFAFFFIGRDLMDRKLVRVAKAEGLIFARSTLYKFHHLNKYPKLFIKVGGGLFIDLDELDHIIEQGRGK